METTEQRYQVFLLVCRLLIPLMLLGFGAVFWAAAGPKHINGLCGYRTRLSMRTRATWCFAHRYLGRLWVVMGLAELAGTLAFEAYARTITGQALQSIMEMLLLTVQLAGLLLTLWPSEHALRVNFDVHGCPITPLGRRLSAEKGEKQVPSPIPPPPPAQKPAAQDAAQLPDPAQDEPDYGPEPDE